MADDPFLDLISTLSEALDDAGVIYAITGSVASSIHGEPYDSKDVDICLFMNQIQAARLAKSLPLRFYRSAEAMTDAVLRCGMANLIDSATGFKIDLCVLPNEPYYQSVLQRRLKTPFGPEGPLFWVVSAEDIILMKLAWRKESQSEKQWQNALSVMKTQFSRLDWRYLRTWAEKLDVSADLELLRKAGEA